MRGRSRTHTRLHWTVNRRKAMSAPAGVFGVGRKIQSAAERAGFGLAHPQRPSGRCGKPWVPHLPRGFDHERYIQAADRILAGLFDVFAIEEVNLGFPPRW